LLARRTQVVADTGLDDGAVSLERPARGPARTKRPPRSASCSPGWVPKLTTAALWSGRRRPLDLRARCGPKCPRRGPRRPRPTYEKCRGRPPSARQARVDRVGHVDVLPAVALASAAVACEYSAWAFRRIVGDRIVDMKRDTSVLGRVGPGPRPAGSPDSISRCRVLSCDGEAMPYSTELAAPNFTSGSPLLGTR